METIQDERVGKWLDSADIAHEMGISLTSARRLIRTSLPHLRVGRKEYRVEPSVWEAWVKVNSKAGYGK